MLDELEKNGIAILREQKKRSASYGQEERAILVQGFTSPFWKILIKDIEKAYAACMQELKTCKEMARINQLQGEVAALDVLIRTAETLSKPAQINPAVPLNFES